MSEKKHVKHTDAAEQARFAALTTEQQLLDIWLNTRETNGAVAELLTWKEEIDPKIARHERFYWGMAAVAVILVFATPFLLWIAEHLEWK